MLKEALHRCIETHADVAFAYSINKESVFYSNYPKDWLTDYIAHQFSLVDPVLTWAHENVGWIDWRDLPKYSEASVDFMKHAEKSGFKFGSVYSTVANGTKCMLAICRSNPERDFDSETELRVAFDALAKLHPPKTKVNLTAKARIYVGLAASGLADKEISSQMRRSERMIKEYRKTAIRSLGAKTLPEATATAITLGIC